MKRLLLGIIVIGFAPLHDTVAQHPPLNDFGYESMRNYSGNLAKAPEVSVQRCLVILLDDDKLPGGFAPGRSAYFQNLIFSLSAIRNNNDLSQSPGSVNGFLEENSNRAFRLSPAFGELHPNGMLGPLTTTDAESDAITAGMTNANEYVQIEVALNVAIRSGWVLKDFDSNNDGVVTDSELLVIVIKVNNNPPRGRTETRTHRGYTPPGQPAGRVASFRGNFVGALDGVDFASLVHEVAHVYGADDIYSFGRTYAGGGPGLAEVNFRLTLMGATYSSDIFHLDCWHKMGLGWARPRIVSMRTGGIFQIPAAQLGDATGPILLYDPVKGTGEYFMLEYRTSAIQAASTYDGQVLQSGVWLWHIQMDPDFRTSDRQRAINVPSPLNLTPNNILNAVWTEGPPYQNGDIGVNQPWTGGATSYFLKWNDGASTRCRFHVQPFLPTDPVVTVEIRAEYDTWVDFVYNGLEAGDFDNPYNTFDEGVLYVGRNGRVRIKRPGSITTTISRISKPMIISAEGGVVTIDR